MNYCNSRENNLGNSFHQIDCVHLISTVRRQQMMSEQGGREGGREGAQQKTVHSAGGLLLPRLQSLQAAGKPPGACLATAKVTQVGSGERSGVVLICNILQI